MNMSIILADIDKVAIPCRDVTRPNFLCMYLVTCFALSSHVAADVANAAFSLKMQFTSLVSKCQITSQEWHSVVTFSSPRKSCLPVLPVSTGRDKNNNLPQTSPCTMQGSWRTAKSSSWQLWTKVTQPECWKSNLVAMKTKINTLHKRNNENIMNTHMPRIPGLYYLCRP